MPIVPSLPHDLSSLNSAGIYQIVNTVNGNVYIGSAKNFRVRWALHVGTLQKAKHANSRLQNDWNIFGEEAFEFTAIEEVKDLSALYPREQFYIDSQNPYYNICRTVGRGRLGLTNSPEHRARVSAGKMGHVHSDETKLKMSEAAKKRGISLHARTLISEALRGRKVSDETRARLSASLKGKIAGRTLAPAHIAKIKASFTPDRLLEMSIQRKGKPLAPETIAKIVAQNTGRKRTPEQIERLKEGKRKGREARLAKSQDS